MKKMKFLLLVILMIFSAVETSLANTIYYKVVGNSMNPALQDEDMIEIVSEEYQDGDMVVAMKKDGTKIVKRLMGDRLVSVGDGTSYSTNEVTILGAARYTPMSLAELEAYGFRWESVLAEGEYIDQVAGGYEHSLALTNTGVVYAWGDNSSGKLGTGTFANSRTPVKVADGAMGNNGVTAIAVGETHSLALKNGKVYAWGSNYYGQLGDGSTQNRSVPVEVANGVMGNNDVTAIAAGGYHNLALKGGKVYAWGFNFFGQLGDQSGANKPTPVIVKDGAMVNSGVTAISAGIYHSIALKGGKVYGWGFNLDGELGDGSGVDQPIPVMAADGVMGNSGITAISAGGYHTLALKGGVVYAWGYNGHGQLGNGTTSSAPIKTPVLVENGQMGNNNVTAIVGGENHSLALKNGKVYTWGANDNGQLGDGSRTNRSTPVEVANGVMGNNAVEAIGKGFRHSFAIKDGWVYSWGGNSVGQLGDGTAAIKETPVSVNWNAQTPQITSQPVGKTAAEGEQVTLTVTASVNDGGILSYQWYQNTTNSNTGGTLITGATSASFSPPTNQLGTVYYYVVVTNTNNEALGNKTASVVSAATAVTVLPLVHAETPVISGPTGATVVEGDPSPKLEVAASVSDGGTFSYQWYQNTTNSNTGGTPITGETNASYFPPTDQVGTVYYYVEVTNTNNTVTGNKTATVASEAADVTVLPLFDAETPTITLQPLGVIATVGTTSPTITVEAQVLEGTLSYQWYRNSINSTEGAVLIDGATDKEFEVPTDTVGTTYYFVVITNNNPNATRNKTASITSNVVEVRIREFFHASAPIITSQPTEVSVFEGSIRPVLTVQAMANDAGELSYQWYQNTINSNTGGTLIDGETNASFAAPTDQVGTFYYYVVVTNTNPDATGNITDSVTSEVITVTVLPLFDAASPVITMQPMGMMVDEGSPSPILTVGATAIDGGILSYQWYQNTTNSNVGGTPIPGATSPSFQAPTNQVGTLYYYVVVTNTNTNATGIQTASITSQVAAVTINALDHSRSDSDDDSVNKTPSNVFIIDPKYGRNVQFEDVELNFPKGVFSGSFSVTINKVKDLPEGLRLNEGRIISEIYEITKNRKGDFQKAITVTFHLENIDWDQYEIGIYRFNEDMKEWIPLDNVRVDSNEKTVSGQAKDVAMFAVLAKEKQDETEPLPLQEEPKPEPTQNFIDILGHWAEQDIHTLVERGLIQGYLDGTFKPDHPITRAEFVAIVVRALGIELTGEKTFSDITDHWAKDVIAAAYEHGIISGYSDTTFGADDPITREQMAAIIVSAFQLKLGQEGKTFVDQEEISSWAKEVVEIAASNGMIRGYEDGTFKPNQQTTRAEAVAILVRILERE